jgi:hypothetical protein
MKQNGIIQQAIALAAQGAPYGAKEAALVRAGAAEVLARYAKGAADQEVVAAVSTGELRPAHRTALAEMQDRGGPLRKAEERLLAAALRLCFNKATRKEPRRDTARERAIAEAAAVVEAHRQRATEALDRLVRARDSGNKGRTAAEMATAADAEQRAAREYDLIRQQLDVAIGHLADLQAQRAAADRRSAT